MFYWLCHVCGQTLTSDVRVIVLLVNKGLLRTYCLVLHSRMEPGDSVCVCVSLS